jgi:hypothetical protein
MHAVVRNYSGKGAEALFDVLDQRKADVEKLMRGVPGFRSYTLGTGAAAPQISEGAVSGHGG